VCMCARACVVFVYLCVSACVLWCTRAFVCVRAYAHPLMYARDSVSVCMSACLHARIFADVYAFEYA